MLLLAFSLQPSALAEVPEPDNILYGQITLGSQVITAADTDVVVEARKSAGGPVVASCRMGENPVFGDFYSLRLKVEAFLPIASPDVNRLGGLVFLSVRDNSGVRVTKSTSLAERGKLTRVDFVEADADGDGLPDAWEQRHFASATAADPNADSDGDGRSNLAEFLAGTDPLTPDGRHPADAAPADNAMSSVEAEDYAQAWQLGQAWSLEPTNIPIGYVSRAAALAQGGGVYLFTNVPPTNAPFWWVSATNPPAAGAVTNLVTGDLPATHDPGLPLSVTLAVVPDPAARAYAVEDAVPADWSVRDVSHGGSFDAVNHKVKWGPFADAGARELYYTLTPPTNAAGVFAFAGVGSFDGLDVAALGARTVAVGSSPSNTMVRFANFAIDAQGPKFVMEGQATRNYTIEVSTNLLEWSVWQTIESDSEGHYLLRPVNATQIPCQFYRVSPSP